MKKIELNLQKRLLIVEYETEAELKIEWALMNAFRNPNITNHGHKVKPICKGIEFNDEIAKDLVKSPDNFQFLDAENTFIGEIENQGYYWGENLIEQPFVEKIWMVYGEFSRRRKWMDVRRRRR
ncbi:hypothetical protein [Chryseobacterium carnipullorum]|uniref:Uncharacterized protein n=1 Tax=Chryseobacterium carnipullorum TaxID=1124835 RepID=A0A376DUN2_CHRCU|nr:hypothetical protein [Chryseobacterium carnipullorum]STC95502.1 Uncharacterised protein [Chryseobacterium carnipullorum]